MIDHNNRQNKEQKHPVLVISGASSGIGRAVAELFARQGWQVYNLSRTAKYIESDQVGIERSHLDEYSERIRHVTTDVSDNDSVKRAIAEICELESRINLVVANAGYGIAGAIEETAELDYQKQFDVNFFGAVRLINACLPILRAQNEGRIIIMSSLAAVLPIPFQAFYSASKSALVSYARALNLEVGAYNIRVSALLPGDIASGFTANREKSVEESSPYYSIYKRSIARMEKDELSGKPASFIAEYIWRIYHKKHPKSMYVAGAKYRLFYFLNCILPLRLADYILGSLYSR